MVRSFRLARGEKTKKRSLGYAPDDNKSYVKRTNLTRKRGMGRCTKLDRFEGRKLAECVQQG
jgi:hypothetical protein